VAALASIDSDEQRLAALTPELANAAPGVLYPIWHLMVSDASVRPRPEAMVHLSFLAPFVPVLGGPNAAADAAAAVKRVIDRWP